MRVIYARNALWPSKAVITGRIMVTLLRVVMGHLLMIQKGPQISGHSGGRWWTAVAE